MLPKICWAHILYILMQGIPNTGRNLLFQKKLCKEAEKRKKKQEHRGRFLEKNNVFEFAPNHWSRDTMENTV